MFDVLFIISTVAFAVQAVKENNQPIVPSENWANKDLYYKDMMNGVSVEQRMKNVQNGKYKLVENYPEPRRDPVSGKIIIENCKLYREDVRNYGAVQAQKWVKQGRYNLDKEGLKREQERIKKQYEYLYSL